MKKIGLTLLVLLELIIIVWVYGIGGRTAPYVWVVNIFVVSTSASLALIIQVILLLVRLMKKKNVRWNGMYLAITLLLAYPVTILFGKSILTYPTNVDDKKGVKMINPIKDSVVFGGKNFKSHAMWPSECYAYDILKEPYNINSDRLTDYGIYLADVYAPIDGTVIEEYDEEEDIAPNVDTYKSSLGNYMFIKIDKTNTYLILAHLERNSITVQVGEHIRQGQILAKVGNSGTTSEPHLHIGHQANDPRHMKWLVCSQGLPIKGITVVNNQ